jgi:predicted Zn finger-like uncharacterized protein
MIALLLLLGTLTTLAAVGYVVTRSREPDETVYHYFRCPACHQKLRCATEKLGGPGMCPRCKQRWEAPPLSKAGTSLADKKRRQPVGRRLGMRQAG